MIFFNIKYLFTNIVLDHWQSCYSVKEKHTLHNFFILQLKR